MYIYNVLKMHKISFLSKYTKKLPSSVFYMCLHTRMKVVERLR